MFIGTGQAPDRAFACSDCAVLRHTARLPPALATPGIVRHLAPARGSSMSNHDLTKSEQHPRSDIPAAYPGTLEVFGELRSIAHRFRMERLAKAIEAEEAVVTAHQKLAVATQAWMAAQERIKPHALEAIKEVERQRIRAERAEAALRLAEKERKLTTFSVRSQIEDEVLAAELAEAKQRRRLAEAVLHGPIHSGTKGESADDLEDELLKVAAKLGELDQLKREKQAAGAGEVELRGIDSQISACLRKKDRLEERLEAVS